MTRRRTRDVTGEQQQDPSICPVCGGPVENAWCLIGGGYPLSLAKNPETCPNCRTALDWDGGCTRCYGKGLLPNPKAWCFPGRRFRPYNGHWVLVDRATLRPVCSVEENRAAAQVVGALLDHRITRAQAHEHLFRIFGHRSTLDVVEQGMEDERDAIIVGKRAGQTADDVRRGRRAPPQADLPWEPGANG